MRWTRSKIVGVRTLLGIMIGLATGLIQAVMVVPVEKIATYVRTEYSTILQWTTSSEVIKHYIAGEYGYYYGVNMMWGLVSDDPSCAKGNDHHWNRIPQSLRHLVEYCPHGCVFSAAEYGWPIGYLQYFSVDAEGIELPHSELRVAIPLDEQYYGLDIRLPGRILLPHALLNCLVWILIVHTVFWICSNLLRYGFGKIRPTNGTRVASASRQVS